MSAEQALKGGECRCVCVLYTCRVDVHQDLVFVVILIGGTPIRGKDDEPTVSDPPLPKKIIVPPYPPQHRVPHCPTSPHTHTVTSWGSYVTLATPTLCLCAYVPPSSPVLPMDAPVTSSSSLGAAALKERPPQPPEDGDASAYTLRRGSMEIDTATICIQPMLQHRLSLLVPRTARKGKKKINSLKAKLE